MKSETLSKACRALLVGVFFLGLSAADRFSNAGIRHNLEPPARAFSNSSLTHTSDVQGGASVNDPNSFVEASKRAIIETGISEAYFDRHFTLVKAVNVAGDNRVEWAFSVNEYRAQVVDAIGFYSVGGRRIYVHGIRNQLYKTHEIVKTIRLEQARKTLRNCIGKFDGESVVFRTLTVPGRARLYLTGRAIPEREREKDKKAEEEDEGRFLYVGFVDVETGKCVKKLGRGFSSQ